MHIVSTGTQLCDKCGKPMANSRVANSQGTFHTECAGLGPFARIAQLEAALKPFSDRVYNDNGDVTYEMGALDTEDLWRAHCAMQSR